MTSATLVNTIEAKSKVISHTRLLEILAATDIETRCVELENNDSLMRITVVSNQNMPLHSHFATFMGGEPLTGMQFLGLGFLPSDDKPRPWLHQWLMLPKTSEDVERFYGSEQIPFEEVKKQIEEHQKSFHAWIETSRGW